MKIGRINISLLNTLTAISLTSIIIGGYAYYYSCTKDYRAYETKNGEYWVNKETYDMYMEYTTIHPPKIEFGYFDTDTEIDGKICNKKIKLYELCDAEKYVVRYSIKECELQEGKFEYIKTPIYDFRISKYINPDIDGEIVLASDGYYYYETPNYTYDQNGNLLIIEGSSLDKIEKKLDIVNSKNKKLIK